MALITNLVFSKCKLTQYNVHRNGLETINYQTKGFFGLYLPKYFTSCGL